MGEWQEYSLYEIVDKFIDYRGKTPKKTTQGIPLITAKVVKNGKILEPNEFIAEEDYEAWMTRGLPQMNDVVLTTEAPLGEVALIKDQNVALAQRIITIRCNPDLASNVLLKYYLQSSKGQYELNSRASGTTVFGIKASILRELPVYLPSLAEQKAIASVLSSLDNKIDLLHRQNKTLEQMAETLFRQWFVDEAKEEWEETTLYDSIELVSGGTPKTSIDKYWNGKIRWLSGGDIASNHKSFIVISDKTITEEGLTNSSAKLLPKFSTVISARGTVGKYCMLSEPMAFSQSNYGIKPKFENCFFFTYLLVNHSVEELNSAAYGSVFDTITTNTFKGLDVCLPLTEEVKDFEEEVRPYFSKILNNQIQILTLEKLRDTLLPKLMSGEITVESENVEKIYTI